MAGTHYGCGTDERRHRNYQPRSHAGASRWYVILSRARPRRLFALAHVYPGAPDQLALDAVLAKLKPWLEDARRPKLGQNLKYDMHILANHGVRLAGIVHDTLLQSYVVESHKPHDMDNMAERISA